MNCYVRYLVLWYLMCITPVCAGLSDRCIYKSLTSCWLTSALPECIAFINIASLEDCTNNATQKPELYTIQKWQTQAMVQSAQNWSWIKTNPPQITSPTMRFWASEDTPWHTIIHRRVGLVFCEPWLSPFVVSFLCGESVWHRCMWRVVDLAHLTTANLSTYMGTSLLIAGWTFPTDLQLNMHWHPIHNNTAIVSQDGVWIQTPRAWPLIACLPQVFESDQENSINQPLLFEWWSGDSSESTAVACATQNTTQSQVIVCGSAARIAISQLMTFVTWAPTAGFILQRRIGTSTIEYVQAVTPGLRFPVIHMTHTLLSPGPMEFAFAISNGVNVSTSPAAAVPPPQFSLQLSWDGGRTPVVYRDLYVPMWLTWTMIALAINAVVANGGVCAWVFYNRKSPIVKAAQPEFLALLTLSGCLGAGAFTMIGLDEQWLSPATLTRVCNLQLHTFGATFTLTFVTLFVKVERVARMILTNDICLVVIHVKEVMPFIVGGVVGLSSVIALWTAFFPVWWERHTIWGEDATTAYTVAHCTMGGGEVLYAAMIGVQLCVYANGLLQCFRVRWLDTDYHESRWITLCIWTNFQALLITTPIVYLVVDMPMTATIIKGAYLLMSSIPVPFLIIGPKIHRLREDKWLDRLSVVISDAQSRARIEMTDIERTQVAHAKSILSKRNMSITPNSRARARVAGPPRGVRRYPNPTMVTTAVVHPPQIAEEVANNSHQVPTPNPHQTSPVVPPTTTPLEIHDVKVGVPGDLIDINTHQRYNNVIHDIDRRFGSALSAERRIRSRTIAKQGVDTQDSTTNQQDQAEPRIRGASVRCADDFFYFMTNTKSGGVKM